MTSRISWCPDQSTGAGLTWRDIIIITCSMFVTINAGILTICSIRVQAQDSPGVTNEIGTPDPNPKHLVNWCV